MKINITRLSADRIFMKVLKTAFILLSLFPAYLAAQSGTPIDIVTTIDVPTTSSLCIDVNSETNFIYASGGASGGQTITFINGADNSIVKTVSGSYAHVNPKTDLVYAGSLSSTILIYNGTSGNYVNSINVSGMAIEAYVDTGINRIWGAAQGGNDPVFVIDGNTNVLEHTINSGGVMGWLAVNPVTHLAYIYPSAYPPKRINTSTWAAEDIGTFSGAVQVVNPKTNIMYASDTNFTEVINGNDETQITAIRGTGCIAVNPVRNRVYIADTKTDSLWVYDARTHDQIAVYPYAAGVRAGSIAVNTQTGLVYILYGATIYVVNDYVPTPTKLRPKNVAAAVNGKDVTVSWDDGGGRVPLKEYRIYQGPDSNNLSFIGSAPASSFTKYNLWGGIYYYRVSAVDSFDNESPMSFAAQAVVNESQHLLGEYPSDPNTALLLHMDEAAGPLVQDASGFANDGFANDGAQAGYGRFGNARQFPAAAAAFVSVKHAPILNLHNGCTVEAWISSGDFGDERPILRKQSGVPGYKLFTNIGRAAFSMTDQLGNTVTLTGTSTVVTPGWKHIAITGDSSMLRLFVNGVEEASIVPSAMVGSPENMDSVLIGHNIVDQFSGSIDEVRLSNRIRSPQEFNLQLPPTNLDTSVVFNQVTLTWNNGGGAAPLMRYRIYRGSSDPDAVSLIDSSVVPNYIDNNASLGLNYYRVTAVDSTGYESVRSNAVCAIVTSMGTAPAAPSNLTILANTASYIDLGWSDNSSNEDYFALERKVGTGGTWQTLNEFISAGSQYYSDNTVVPSTLYYYRVRARSLTDGYSGYSNEASATTPGAGDTRGPIISDGTSYPLPVIHVTNGAVSSPPVINITASAYDEDGVVSYLGIQYIKLGETHPTDISFPSPYGAARSVQIPNSVFINNKGLADAVSYRLMAVDNSANISTTAWHQFVVRNETEVFSQSDQPSSESYGDAKWRAYRIVSIPFIRDDLRPVTLMQTSFGDHSEENVVYARWRFQRWNSGLNAYQDYETFQNQNVLTSGAGFFLIVKNPGQRLNGGTGRIADVGQLDTIGINLEAGWNLVGNPFDVNIPVGNLSFVSSPVDSIRQTAYFSGAASAYGGWEIGTGNATLLYPWQGLAVRVGRAGSLHFKVPGGRYGLMKQSPVQSIAEVAHSAQEDAMNWVLPVSAERADNGIQCKGNVIGMAGDAKDGDDKYDVYMPPFIGDNNVMVYFSNPDGAMLRDIRPLNEEGEIWEMHVVTGDAGARIKLQFAENPELPDPQFELYLIDIDQRMAYNLNKTSSLEITSGENARNFRLIAGKKSYVQQNNAGVELAPSEIKLFANYPNPFNPSTIIRYSIPEASAAYKVTLKIFNMLGQEVTTLINREQTAGYHEIKWDAQGQSSGVYFYQLTVSNGLRAFRDVKKMILMK